MKVIKILAGAYTLFIVAPVTWLLWDNILKDRPFGNIFGLGDCLIELGCLRA